MPPVGAVLLASAKDADESIPAPKGRESWPPRATKIPREKRRTVSTVEQQIADLIKPGVVDAWYLSDGSTARSRYPHDGARPVIEDVEATLSLAKRSGKLIQVDSIDAETDSAMDTFIVPQHVVTSGSRNRETS
jgi:hypothetical protein